MNQFIAYYRVSSKQQGDGKNSGTGYGIDAQVRDVECFSQRRGGAVIDEYTEVESGSNNTRPKLWAAIAKCRVTGATLVVAKLDRLTRSLRLICDLEEGNVDFICCDNPNATPLTIHLLAAVAQDELRRISERTKAGLASAKLRGVKLGSARPGFWKGREHLWRKGLETARTNKSAEIKNHYAYLLPRIKLMRENGDTLETIVKWLNDDGHLTSTKKPFTISVLYQLITRSFGRGFCASPARRINLKKVSA